MEHSDSDTEVGWKVVEVTPRRPRVDLHSSNLSRVRSIINSHNSEPKIAVKILAPQWQHRYIIGRQGRNIKTLTEGLKVNVSLIRETQMMKIEGRRSHVQTEWQLLSK